LIGKFLLKNSLSPIRNTYFFSLFPSLFPSRKPLVHRAPRSSRHTCTVPNQAAKGSWVPLSCPGCAAGTVHRRDPATDQHRSFDLLRFRPGPVHPSLGDLVPPGSPENTISMLILAWTPARHSSLQPRTPGLKLSASLSLPGAWITGTSHRARLAAAHTVSALQHSGIGLTIAAGCIGASAAHGRGGALSARKQNVAFQVKIQRNTLFWNGQIKLHRTKN